MCLSIISNHKTATNLPGKGKWVTIYKVLNRGAVDKNYWCSPYRHTLYRHGWKYSNRESSKLTAREAHSGYVERGIHVYLSKRKAQDCANLGWGRKVVKCRALRSDFVAKSNKDHGDAVFTKIFITKDDLEAAGG